MTQTNTTQNKEELKTKSKTWQQLFSEKFTDNILENGYGNDLIIGKEDVETLMDFIQTVVDTSISQAHQSGIEEERKRIIKIIESFIDPNPVFLEEHREKIFLKEVIKSLKENKQ